MSRLAILVVVLVFVSQSAFGQQSAHPPAPKLPCDYKRELFQSAGKPHWLSSKDMKRRAIQKVDVGLELKNLDINMMVIATMIVREDGSVECVKSIHSVDEPRDLVSFVGNDVENALRKWKFKPMKLNRKPVSYVGILEFQFCRIDCSEGKSSVTLLN